MSNKNLVKIHGSKSVFAIQWAFDSYHDLYYYGYFCFWINSCVVGNFDEMSTLSIVKNYLVDFLKGGGGRTFEGSLGMSKDELFYQLYWRFYEADSTQDYGQLGGYRDMYWLDDIGEYSFRDTIGMILIDEPELGRQRLIWKDFKSDVLNEFFIPKGQFEKIGTEFLGAFDQEVTKSTESPANS